MDGPLALHPQADVLHLGPGGVVAGLGEGEIQVLGVPGGAFLKARLDVSVSGAAFQAGVEQEAAGGKEKLLNPAGLDLPCSGGVVPQARQAVFAHDDQVSLHAAGRQVEIAGLPGRVRRGRRTALRRARKTLMDREDGQCNSQCDQFHRLLIDSVFFQSGGHFIDAGQA